MVRRTEKKTPKAKGAKAESAKEKKVKQKAHNWIQWISIFLLVGLVASYFIFPAFKEGINEAYQILTSDDENRIKNWVQKFGAWGPIVLICATAFQMFMLIVPNLLLFAISIICYGPIWGGLICFVGVFCSSSLGYYIGRRLGPKAIDRFVSQKTQDKIAKFIQRYGAKAVAALRVSSLATDSLGFAAGILEMTYKKFILATMVGITPVIVAVALFGRNGNVEKGLLWLAGISLVALGIYIFIDRKKQRS